MSGQVWNDMRLTAIRFVAQGISLFEFRLPDGRQLTPAEPGSHIELRLSNGLTRHYSLLTCDGDQAARVVAVKREPDGAGGSAYIHDKLKVGDLVSISEPRNTFPLIEDATYNVLIGGGIGITPIFCMAQRLSLLGRSYELHYACRNRNEGAFLAELSTMREANVHIDTERAGDFLDLEPIVEKAPAGAHFYCCGPLPMLSAFEEATRHLPDLTVHTEYFSPKEQAAKDGGYIVELQDSGGEFIIPPGKTILEVLLSAGVDVAYSCQEGVCGACEASIVSGEPDHRDSVLNESERQSGKTLMICCSGSKSARLILAL